MAHRLPVHTPPAADNAFDVLRGAGARHSEETLLRLGRGDPRDRPHLGVGDLTTPESLRQARQRPERAGHAHTLSRRARIQSNAPAQPGSARAEAMVPAAARVEVSDAIEQSRRGGLEVRRELRDLITETIQL